jgi:hypothetical protein
MQEMSYDQKIKNLTENRNALLVQKDKVIDYFAKHELKLSDFQDKTLSSIFFTDIIAIFFGLLFLAIIATVLSAIGLVWLVGIVLILAAIAFFKQIIGIIIVISIIFFGLLEFGFSDEDVIIFTSVISFFAFALFRFIVVSKRKTMTDSLNATTEKLKITDNAIIDTIKEPIIDTVHKRHLLSFDDIIEHNDPRIPTHLVQKVLDEEVEENTIESIKLPKNTNIVLYKSTLPISQDEMTTVYLEIN